MMNRQPIWSFFIKHRKFTLVLVFSILFMGLFSAVTMPKEANPEVKIPMAVVTTPFIGASPEDVEVLVTDTLENQILSLDGVSSVNSTSAKGLSMITIEYNANEDMDEKLTDLKEAVDRAKFDLPDDVEDSTVQKVSFDDQPILTFAVGGPYPLELLTEYAEELADEMERVAGVSRVDVLGGKSEEIQILVNREALDTYGLSLGQVTQAISSANTDIPIGFIETAGEEFTVRLEGQLDNAEQIENLPIQTRNGSTIFIRDVAEVKETYAEARALSRLSSEGSLPSDALSLRIYKAPDADILNTVDALNKTIEESEFLPKDATILVVEDFAKYIREDLGNLLNSGTQTVLIVMVLLLLFLGWREALLAGFSIPMTFLITFAGLSAFGYTLNSLTLFALILSLGILVDTSIVITEAIYVRMREGMTSKEAAIDTVRQYQYPLISGVLTTVFAFVPMLLTSGIIGEFIKSIPITVSIALSASLFVGLGLVTTAATVLFRTPKPERETPSTKDSVEAYLKDSYIALLEKLIFNKWATRLLALALLLLFAGSMSLPATGVLQVNMFPATDEDSFYIDFELPVGTPLSDTDSGAQAIEDLLLEDERVESFMVNVGSSSGMTSDFTAASTSDAHLASFVVNLKEDREETSIQVVDEYSEAFAELEGKISVIQLGAGPGSSAPVELRVTGEDIDTVEQVAKQMENLLESIPGTKDVSISMRESNGELVLEIDRVKANSYGLSTLDVAFTLNNALSGSTATVLRGSGDNIDVVVKYDFDEATSQWDRQIDVEDLQSITLVTAEGDIPLRDFVNITLGNSRTSVSHLDGDRIIRVTSYTEGEVVAQTIFEAVSESLKSMDIPDDVQISLGGEREDIQQSYNDMARAFILAIFLIAGLLILQFDSFRQPIFILATIPLALIGVLPGLTLMGQPLSFPGIIGLVALAGIVVNNAIILIDQINKNRLTSTSMQSAILDACASRFQPIILTTITTVAGILPLALTNDFWGPLAYAIVYGLLFSTVLTLVVVPVLYERFEK